MERTQSVCESGKECPPKGKRLPHSHPVRRFGAETKDLAFGMSLAIVSVQFGGAVSMP
jgi:hypothetical protein